MSNIDARRSMAGKSVLITGCSSGIGRETARHLARLGCTVFATVRKERDRDELGGLGELNLIPLFPLDLSDRNDIPSAQEFVERELRQRNMSGLSALVLNAGGGAVAPLELMDLDGFERELRARLVGSIALVQAFLPMLRAGNGRIVWIVTPATIPTPYVASIHVCDFAANCLARTLDIELLRWGIPSVQIRCGGIKTAKGLETTKEVEAILRHPKADLYRESLEKWSTEMADFDRKRTPPEKVAEQVERALRSRSPKRRYSVGYMHMAAAMLEALPQSLTDRILKSRFGRPPTRKSSIRRNRLQRL
jgi:NAD(P)-dependent dehydrogenase (short-subunit alcohol dehydrogenase family)